MTLPTLAAVFIFAGVMAIFFSGLEAGLFGLSRLRVRQQVRAGNRRAAILHDQLASFERVLRNVLAARAIAEVVVLSLAVVCLWRLFRSSPGLFSSAVCATAFTYYALGRLAPKVLFRSYPNRLTILLAPYARPFTALAQPLGWLTKMLARLFAPMTTNRRFMGKAYASRDELRLMMQETAALTVEEQSMIHRVLDLQNLTVAHIAIPMASVTGVTATTLMADIVGLHEEHCFTRMPVWQVEGDGAGRRVLGMVDINTIIFSDSDYETKTAGDCLAPCPHFAADMRLEVALRELQRTNQRMAIVAGSDGAEIGIVTLQDILKTIFGEVTL